MNYFLLSKQTIENLKIPKIDDSNDDPFNFTYWFAGKLKDKIYSSELYGAFTSEELLIRSPNLLDNSDSRENIKDISSIYPGLLSSIDYSAFKIDVNTNILKQEERLISDLTLYEEHKPNFIIDLKNNLDFLHDSITFLNGFTINDNGIMLVIEESYLLSYHKIIEILEHKYKQIYPGAFDRSHFDLINIKQQTNSEDNERIENPFNKEDLNPFFFPDQLEFYYKNEIELIHKKIIQDSRWVSDKKKLIELVFILKHRNYFKDSVIKNKSGSDKKLSPIFTFFEKRYHIKLGDQKKPSKNYSILATLDKNLFPFFTIPKS
ncbi:hypothetical protein [Flavobacterium sp. PL12]|uniref:hypothetical protein n=1 Tax=Flavobacterium sp. PL12 TaxID=3071718 RepID=UPI00319E4E21